MQNITTAAFSDASVVSHNDTNEVVVVGTNGKDIVWQTFSPSIVGSIINLESSFAPCSDADIARDPSGTRYAIAYQIDFDDRTIINLTIRDANGAEITTFTVDDPFTSGFSAANASVAYLGDGGIVVAWDRTDASGNTAIWYAIRNGDGGIRQGPRALDNVGSINAHPSVSSSGFHGFMIAYEDNASGVSQIQTYTVGTDGNALGFKTATSGATAHSDAAVADLGNIYGAAYTNTFDSGGFATYVELALYDRNGRTSD